LEILSLIDQREVEVVSFLLLLFYFFCSPIFLSVLWEVRDATYECPTTAGFKRLVPPPPDLGQFPKAHLEVFVRVAQDDAPAAVVVLDGFELDHRARALAAWFDFPQGYFGPVVHDVVVLLQGPVVVRISSRNDVILISAANTLDPPFEIGLVCELARSELGPVEDAPTFEVHEAAGFVLKGETVVLVGGHHV